MERSDNMRFEQLECIVAVAEYGSMNKAAKHLHTSQQNVSKMVKQLEDCMHIAIFYRVQKGVVLTPQGEILYKFARKQMERFQLLQEKLYQIQCNTLQGVLSVCTMNSGTSMIIPQMLCEFYKNYGNVTLQITDGTAHTVIQQVEQQQVDLGILTYMNLDGQIQPDMPETLKLVPLIKGDWYFWVSEHSIYAQKGFITLAEANQESILIDDVMDVELLAQLFSVYSLSVKVGMQVKNLCLLGKLVAEGQGVFPDMLFPTNELLYSYVFQRQPGLTAVPVKIRSGYSAIGYLIHKNKKRDTLVSHAIKFLEHDPYEKEE